MRHERIRSDPRVVRFAGAALACVGIVLLTLAAGFAWSPRQAIADWTPTDARIVSAFIESETGPDGVRLYRPQIHYRYAVAGRERAGRAIALGPERAFARRSGAERFLDRFPLGASVRAWFDPRDPDRAVLTADPSWALVALLGLAGFGFIASGYAVFRLVRRRGGRAARIVRAAW